MRKRAWLSAVLFFGLLSPVVLQSNVCGPVEYSKLERLELWVAGQNEIAAFDSAQLAYEASAPSAEMTATLVFEARDPSATVTVEYASQEWQFQEPSGEVLLDVQPGYTAVSVRVLASSHALTYFVHIRRGMQLDGLGAPVEVTTDVRGVPHIVAETWADAFHAQGYLHARDRLFQMDYRRKRDEGRLSELFGASRLIGPGAGDPASRVLGFPLAAERAMEALSAEELKLYQAYVDGVNAWIATNPLPPEYARLGITSVEPWEVTDTLMLVQRSNQTRDFGFDIWMSDRLNEAIGELGEVYGRALWFEDTQRQAPMDPAAVVPDATTVALARKALPRQSEARAARNTSTRLGDPETTAVIKRFATRLEEAATSGGGDAPFARDEGTGSNSFIVTGDHTTTGRPMVAGDGHSSIGLPNNRYEVHLTVTDDSVHGHLNASGMSISGTPGFDRGQTEYLAWTGTAVYIDVCDTFADRLLRDAPGCPADLCIESEGALHPVEERDEVYMANDLAGRLFDATILVADQNAVKILSVPFRSNGPIVELGDRSIVDDPVDGVNETTALTVQCVGFHGTREPRAHLGRMKAKNVSEFWDAVRNVAQRGGAVTVADAEGNVGYIVPAEIPLRADLEQGVVFGDIPVFVRDGSGLANWIADPARSEGQAIPYRVLPFEELPQVINPPAGFVVTANSSQTGFDLDNDITNDFRPSNPSAIHYFGPQYALGLRAGRLTRLIRDHLAGGTPVTLDDMKAWQTNTQALDAELLLPFLFAAWDNANTPGAPPELVALAADLAVEEAVGRLSAWDFSTPTGIPEGYDSSDVDGMRNPTVSAAEAANSVGATLYASWRAELIRSVMYATLADAGFNWTGGFLMRGLLHHLDQAPFTGVGASGVNFFPEPAGLPPEARRDVTVLTALQNALGILASPAYVDAFGGSTNQADYRWGLLKRIQLNTLFGDRAVPPFGGFQDLSPQLPGISREGGWQVVNVLSKGANEAHAQSAQAFVGSAGSQDRSLHSVGDPAAGPDGVLGYTSMPGGPTTDPSSPYFLSQLDEWLTGDHHPIPMNEADVAAIADKLEIFTPMERIPGFD